jgi:flagellin
VQAENSTNSATDRRALDAEVQQRLAEIQRIATQTSYNGTNLLDGTFSGAQFQVGANVGETIALSSAAQNVQTNSLGAFVSQADTTSVTSVTDAGFVVTPTNGSLTLTGAATNGNAGGSTYQGVNSQAISGSNLQINGTYVQASSQYAGNTYQDSTSAYAKALAINATGISGLTATANTTITFDPVNTAGVGSGNFLVFLAIGTPGASHLTYGLTVNGKSVLSQTLTTTGANVSITTATVAAAVNSQSSTTSVAAVLNSNGTISFTAADGRNIVLGETYYGTNSSSFGQQTASVIGTGNSGGGTVLRIVDAITYRGQVTLNSTSGLTFNTSANNATIGVSTSTGSIAASSSLSAQNVQTPSNANSTIFAVDAALTTVNGYRATYGAVTNRLTSAVSAIGSQSQNLTTGNGRITSADFAAETTNLLTTQVIQQAGTSILAQANSLAQGILKLLQ